MVVLADGVDPKSAAGRERIDHLSREVRRDDAVAAVSNFINTGSKAFISRDGDATYLAVALKPAGEDAQGTRQSGSPARSQTSGASPSAAERWRSGR